MAYSEEFDSWSPEDHIRHFLYRAVWACLSQQRWDQPHYKVLDFGSQWYGDPDGGWQTHVRWMLKGLFGGQDRFEHVLGTYPQYNVERLSGVADQYFDIVVLDQVLEHVERPWLAAPEVLRVTKHGGVAIVATPGLFPIHRSPKDCWRIMPDGYDVLFPEAEWETLTRGMWGSVDRIGFEYSQNGGFPDGPPATTVEQALRQPHYAEGSDGRCPIQLWWVGRRR